MIVRHQGGRTLHSHMTVLHSDHIPMSMATSTSTIACFFHALINTRRLYDEDADRQPDNVVQVLSISSLFRYNIPSFDLLAVEMRQLKVKEYTL